MNNDSIFPDKVNNRTQCTLSEPETSEPQLSPVLIAPSQSQRNQEPPACNTGVEDNDFCDNVWVNRQGLPLGVSPVVSITIDWLSFTLKDPDKAAAFYERYRGVEEPGLSDGDGIDKPKCPALFAGEVPCTPRNGYTHGYESPMGVTRFVNPSRPEMGTHYELSGSVLRTLFEQEIFPFELLHNVIEFGAKVTRLDLAKDAVNQKVNLGSIWWAIKNGRTTGRARDWERIQGEDGGCTINIGSRQSDKFVRVYDKGVESKTGADWKRMEIELKHDTAKTIARVLAANPQEASAVFNELITSMIDMSCKAWRVFFSLEAAIGLPKIEKVTDRDEWIRHQLIHALADHATKCPDSAALADLRRILNAHDELYQSRKSAKPATVVPVPALPTKVDYHGMGPTSEYQRLRAAANEKRAARQRERIANYEANLQAYTEGG